MGKTTLLENVGPKVCREILRSYSEVVGRHSPTAFGFPHHCAWPHGSHNESNWTCWTTIETLRQTFFKIPECHWILAPFWLRSHSSGFHNYASIDSKHE